MTRSRYRDILRDGRNFYSGWVPKAGGYTWMNNEAYQRWKQELHYLREHPSQADPARLLALMDRIINTWNKERRDFSKEFNALIEAYNDAIERLNGQEEEFVRLNGVINSLQQRINEAVVRQNELQSRLDNIERRRGNDAALALNYRNEAVEILNRFVDVVCFEKYAPGELEHLRNIIAQIDARELSSGAVQGLALDCIVQAQTLENKVERKRSEFEILHIVAMQQVEELKARFDRWADDTYFDDEKKHKMDMDFWSRGYWNQAYEQMLALYQSVLNAPQAIGYTIDNLKEDMETIQQLHRDGEDIVEKASALSNQSEMAYAMGELVASVLCEMFHFRKVFMGYNNDDERESYVVQMYNHAYEMKIQFILTPMNEREIGCVYHASTCRYVREELLDEIMKHIVAELQFNKVTVLEPEKKDESHWVPDIKFVPEGKKLNNLSYQYEC